MPKFSIIIPVYNVAPYLRECLDSILAQTYANWEAVCVDDGSTDGSGAILDEYRGRVGNDKVVVVNQKNQGVSVARNVALDVADGEWILFLDGDDVLHPDALRRVSKAIADNDVNLVGFRLKRFGEHERCSWDLILNEDQKKVDVSGSFANTPTYNFTCCVYRRGIVTNIRFGRQIIGEDVLFLTKAVDRASSIILVGDVLYGYRVRKGSAIISSISARKVLDMIDVSLGMLRIYDNSNKFVPDQFWRIQCNCIFEKIPILYLRLGKRDRRLVLKMWLGAVRWIAHCEKVGRKRRVRARFGRALPRLMMQVGGALHWLKSKGLHR